MPIAAVAGMPKPEHEQRRHQDTTAHPRQTDEHADDQTVDRQQPVSTHPLPSSRLAWQSSRFLAGNRPIPTKSIAFTGCHRCDAHSNVCRVRMRRSDPTEAGGDQAPRSRATVAPSPPWFAGAIS